jgi:hypothetical protein
MTGSRSIAIAAAFGTAGMLCALAGSLWLTGRGDAVTATMPHPVWTEVAWPFPIDEWGKGKAFSCRAADCGTEVNVYVRAKIGFCNCTTGVADDAELERLSDFDLVGGRVAALDDGGPIAIGWMTGRSRAYGISDSARGGRSALSIAFNNDCDAIVATAVLGRDRRAEIEPQVIGFLNGNTVLQWAKTTLGL